jgi:hypothetical protein
MTSGSKYRIVGWRLLWCSGMFWSLPGLLLLVSSLSSVVGGQLPGRFLEKLLNMVISSVALSSLEER